jgi:hypothetical protein
MNMDELGYIVDNDEVSGSIVSNDGSILIEMTRTKSDMHSLWSSTPSDEYYSSRVTISFKDALTKRTILDIHTNPSMVSCMLDSIESWISFNYSYDCICPLGYTDIMGNTYEFSFTIMNCNNQYAFPTDPLLKDTYQFPYKYFLEILQYNPIEERIISRLKVELEEVSDVDENTVQNNGKCTLYDFCDMLFYVTFYSTEIYDTEWRL